MPTNVLVLGAGFGGLELTTRLSEEFGSDINVTLIDKGEGFVFGFAKFDVLFGWKTLDQVRALYKDILKPGVVFKRENILSIDPVAKRVVTDRGTYEADILVVALGAEYDFAATPGLSEGGHEFYSLNGCLELRDFLPTFKGGRILVSVLGEPYKCPPAPCEMGMLLHQWFSEHNQRQDVSITVASPFPRPIPPSPDGSKAILERFAECDIEFLPQTLVTSIDPATRTAHLADGGTLPYDLFIGVPKHRVPDVVANSPLVEGGWIPVGRGNLLTRFPNVYAVGDVTSVGSPKAGVFSENAAIVVANEIIQGLRGGADPAPFAGNGTCYIEFGNDTVAKLEADFFSGPSPVAPLREASAAMAEEKKEFAITRRQRWFGYEA